MRSAATASNTASESRTSAAEWLAVCMLMLSTFLVVTSEMMPVGVLTPMADGLGISSGAAGFSLTITGLISAATAPVVPRLLGDLDRRAVLAAAMLVLAVGNGLTTIAGGFELLVLGRVILGIGMGAVWGMASAVAIRLVAARSAALAVSFAVSGVAAASVLGVPLGILVGNVFDWRVAFGSLSALALLVGAGVLLALPTLRRPVATADDPAAGQRRHTLARPAVITGLAVVALLVTAHFAAYTFVRPVLEQRAELSAAAITLMLLLYGVFGLIGNFVAGSAAGRRPRGTVLALAAGIMVAIAILAVFGTEALVAGLAIALWGVAYGGLSVAGQLWMTSAAPDRLEHVTGIYVGVFTASIALGAFVGGLVVEGAGIVPLLWGGAAAAGAALLTGVISGRAGRADPGGAGP